MGVVLIWKLSMISYEKKLKLIFDFKKFWQEFLFYIYTIKKYWECWSYVAQGLAGGRKAKEKGKWILYYIILYYIFIYIYTYLLTFCRFVQKPPPFLLTVFFILTRNVEAGTIKNAPSLAPLTLPQIFRNFTNPQCLHNKINDLTK